MCLAQTYWLWSLPAKTRWKSNKFRIPWADSTTSRGQQLSAFQNGNVAVRLIGKLLGTSLRPCLQISMPLFSSNLNNIILNNVETFTIHSGIYAHERGIQGTYLFQKIKNRILLTRSREIHRPSQGNSPRCASQLR